MKIFVWIESRCNFFFSFRLAKPNSHMYRSYLCRERPSSWKFYLNVFNKHVRKWCRKLSQANASEREKRNDYSWEHDTFLAFFSFSLALFNEFFLEAFMLSYCWHAYTRLFLYTILRFTYSFCFLSLARSLIYKSHSL